MISFNDAREIALEYLNNYWQDPRLDIVDDLTIEKEWGWIFRFQSKRWISSRNRSDLIVPGVPAVAIERLDGSKHYLDDGKTIEECIQKYEFRKKIEKSIIEAVKSNDIEQMKSIVECGYKFTKHNSPLELANLLGNTKIINIR